MGNKSSTTSSTVLGGGGGHLIARDKSGRGGPIALFAQDGTQISIENVFGIMQRAVDNLIAKQQAKSGASSAELLRDTNAFESAMGKSRDLYNSLAFIAQEFNTVLSRKDEPSAASPLEQMLGLHEAIVVHLLKREDLRVIDEYRVFLFLAAWIDRRLEKKWLADMASEIAGAVSATEVEVKQPRNKLYMSHNEGGETQVINPSEESDATTPTQKDKERKKAKKSKKTNKNKNEQQPQQPQQPQQQEQQEVELHKDLLGVESAQNMGTDDIPAWKLSKEYIDALRREISPYLEYIRFAMFSPLALHITSQEGIVPDTVLEEAYRFQFYERASISLGDEPRFRKRRYMDPICWNTNWHGLHIQLQEHDTVALKVSAGWYSVVVAKQGWKVGIHAWACEVQGAECTVGIATSAFRGPSLDNYLGYGTSWGIVQGGNLLGPGATPGAGTGYSRGDVIGCVLDMTAHTLAWYKNGTYMGVAFTGLPDEMLYPAVGWRDGTIKIMPGHARGNTLEIFNDNVPFHALLK